MVADRPLSDLKATTKPEVPLTSDVLPSRLRSALSFTVAGGVLFLVVTLLYWRSATDTNDVRSTTEYVTGLVLYGAGFFVVTVLNTRAFLGLWGSAAALPAFEEWRWGSFYVGVVGLAVGSALVLELALVRHAPLADALVVALVDTGILLAAMAVLFLVWRRLRSNVAYQRCSRGVLLIGCVGATWGVLSGAYFALLPVTMRSSSALVETLLFHANCFLFFLVLPITILSTAVLAVLLYQRRNAQPYLRYVVWGAIWFVLMGVLAIRSLMLTM